jgi:hypothetical protein
MPSFGGTKNGPQCTGGINSRAHSKKKRKNLLFLHIFPVCLALVFDSAFSANLRHSHLGGSPPSPQSYCCPLPWLLSPAPLYVTT